MSKQETEKVQDILSKYTEGVTIQNQPYRQFGDRNLIDYKDEMTRRANGDISHLNLAMEKPVPIPVIRKIVKSYVSKVASNMIQMQIKANDSKTGVFKKGYSQAISTLHDWSNLQSMQEFSFHEKAFNLPIEGTSIEYEGYINVTAKRKVIDGDEEIEKDFVIERGPITKYCVLEDILVPDIFQPDIQKQVWIIYREKMHFEMAKKYYGYNPKYHNVDKVSPGDYWTNYKEASWYSQDQKIPDIPQNFVELIHYYSIEGIYCLIMNGQLIYEGVNPYKHGKYPFVKTIHDIFPGGPFFYGRSYVEQILGLADAFNIHYNLLIEKQRNASANFLLTEDSSDFEDIETINGTQVINVKDVGRVKMQKFAGIDNSDISLLGRMYNDIEDLAGNPAGGANATTPGGGRVLLQQTLQLAEEALKQIGYSIKFLEKGEKERVMLRISNLFQFLSIPEQLDGNGTALSYMTIRQDNQTLSDGQRGVRIIKLMDKSMESLTEDIQSELGIEEASVDGNAEAIAIYIETFEQLKMYVTPVSKSSYEATQNIEMQKWIQYAQARLSIDQTTNTLALAEELDRIMGVDSDKFSAQQQSPITQVTNPLNQALAQQAQNQAQSTTPLNEQTNV